MDIVEHSQEVPKHQADFAMHATKPSPEEGLVDVRCPLPRGDGTGRTCNRLVVRVKRGSKGEAYCPRHDTTFSFEVV